MVLWFYVLSFKWTITKYPTSNQESVIDPQLALSLIYVEVPIGLLVAWLAGVLVERGRDRVIAREAQVEAEKIRDLRNRIQEHHKAVIKNIEAWRYNPGSEGEALTLTDANGFVDVADPEDKKHLEKYGKAWKFYQDGPNVWKDLVARNQETTLFIIRALRTKLKPFNLSADVLGGLAYQIIQSIEQDLEHPDRQISDWEKPNQGNYPDVWNIMYVTITGVTRESASDIYERATSVRASKKVRERVKLLQDAKNAQAKNQSDFDAEKTKIVNDAKSSIYSDEILEEGECSRCKSLKEKLRSMGP